MYAGMRHGATAITSNRIFKDAKSVRPAMSHWAARSSRFRWRFETASSAFERSDRAFTSTMARTCPRRATTSISPTGVRWRWAMMRYPWNRNQMTQMTSADQPRRQALRRLAETVMPRYPMRARARKSHGGDGRLPLQRWPPHLGRSCW